MAAHAQAAARAQAHDQRLDAVDSCWLPGCWSGSYDQGGDARAKQSFAATACVVHELEEAEIERQLVLGDAPVRPQSGAQQGPAPLELELWLRGHGADVPSWPARRTGSGPAPRRSAGSRGSGP